MSAFELCLSPLGYFNEVVGDALNERGIATIPLARSYLAELLCFYVSAENLFDEADSSGRKSRATLAEMFLRATNSDHHVRIELLKKLGDRSLYISGFFGDSLQRKIIDIDYYAEMGCSAYASLSQSVREDAVAQVYREFANRFLEFVDVLGHISTKAQLQSEENILRLYENYARTGSDLAREKLLAKGVIAFPPPNFQKKKQ